MEKIEVVRAATADTSTRAIAGTINIILKRAASKGRREWKAGYGHSPGMGEGKASLNLSKRDGKLSYSVAANASRNTFRRPVLTTEWGKDGAGQPLYQHALRGADVGNFNTFNLTPSMNWELDNGDKLGWDSFVYLNRLHYDSRYLTEYLAGAPRIDPATRGVTLSSRATTRSDPAWTHQLGNSAKREARVGFDAGTYSNELGQQSQAASGVLAQDRFVDGLARDRVLRSRGKYTGQAGAAHVVGFGWETSAARNTNDRNQADFGAASTAERYRANVALLALYAQDEWTVSPQWSLYFGARWEGIRIDSSGGDFPPGEHRGSVFSPLLHTLYKLPGNGGDQLRLALTRTYKAPEAAKLVPRRTLTLNNSASNPDSIGNPDLGPELALGIDGSYEHRWAKDALFSVSAAARRIDDCTVQELRQESQATGQGAGRRVQRPRNGGRCDVRTVELETRFPLQTVAAGAPPLDLRFSVGRNWSRVQDIPGPANRLAEQVPLSISAGVDYKAGALTTGGAFVFKRGGQVRLSQK